MNLDLHFRDFTCAFEGEGRNPEWRGRLADFERRSIWAAVELMRLKRKEGAFVAVLDFAL